MIEANRLDRIKSLRAWNIGVTFRMGVVVFSFKIVDYEEKISLLFKPETHISMTWLDSLKCPECELGLFASPCNMLVLQLP
jgi:hypothetical protein